MDKFKELEALVASMKEDVDKFYTKGNSAAGVRIRKTLQDVRSVSQELRKDISEQKKATKK